jgi:ABC-type transporter Mla MlaB component
VTRSDDVPAPARPAAFNGLVTPGRPVTFLGGACHVVVARDELIFDVALRGSLTRANDSVVARVLEAIVGSAQVMNVSLGRLADLDAAGAAMLEEIEAHATRAHVVWSIVDGGLAWQLALDRRASGPVNAPPPARRRWARAATSGPHGPPQPAIAVE